ncbi:cadherin domain-containing protein [Fibrobacter sp.]|uniref:cadherin domain-containing protein n=1 Tax=Fibrobacter sp. TaxID=35828 RepID=UPI0025BAC15E|nr:cadherin domain-containing protein [Fibrobacter sp.]MBR3071279.1 cadherin domain-containing protein [Fibrobacter sp.]
MLSKFGLKVAALVLVGTVSSMAQGVAPITFGDSKTDVNNWNYLTQYKLWGTNGIELGNRPGFYNPKYFNKSTKSYPPDLNYLDSLGAVGTLKNLESKGDGGWLDGPIVVGGNITNSGQNFELLTGPVRTNGSIAAIHNDVKTTCSLTNVDGNCSPDKVPDYRSTIKVPTLSGSIAWRSAITVPNSRRYTIDVNNMCPGTGTCDIFYESINFENDGRLVVAMPAEGRTTRIFTKALNMSTHPQIVVRYPDGELKPNQYQGNLLIYVDNNITFVNTDNADMMGTLVSNGTIEMRCNMIVSGQFIANKIVIGNEIEAEKFTFKPFNKVPELSILGNRAIYFEEGTDWKTINVELSESTPEKVTFGYCFEFYSATGAQNNYAGYQDVGDADASHKFPICNKGEEVKVTIPANQTKAEGIYIKPLLDGYVEKDEQLWFQVTSIENAKLANDYEQGKGYKIYIVSNDKLPTVSSELVVNVNEDEKHTFTAAEFKFQHESQSLAAVIITSLPASGTLVLNGEAVKSGNPIDVSSFSKFTYTPDPNEFGNNYTTFGYKVVGDGTVDNTSIEYTATVNVIPVNDKPAASDVVFIVNELDHAIAGGPIEVTDVSNERSLDTYTFKLVNVTGSDLAAFNDAFEIVKLTGQNATIKVKTGAVLDYSQKKEYVVYATVSDDAATETSVQAGPQTSEQFKITVKVKNENDDPVIAPQEFFIAEKQADGSDWPSGTSVGKVVAFDPDDDPLSFTVDASENVPFKFLNSTNELVVTDGSKLDYEAQTGWKFRVIVSDGQGGSNATSVIVHITDVNEKPEPENVKSEYSVAENSIKGTVVGSFDVFDNDKISTAYETLTYTLTGALTGVKGGTTAKDMGEIFEVKESGNIGGARTVQIVVKDQALLDYEALFNGTNATYPVTITIADAKNSIEVTTKIAVTDVNEKHSATGGTFYVLEHSAGGTSVCSQKHNADGECEGDYGQVKFIDPDLNNALKFKMSAANTGDDASAFAVDYQGFIKTSGNEEFEYDGTGAKREYTFLVTVYDTDFSVDVEVTVKIEDIEEPKIELTVNGSGSIKENADNNSVADKFSKEKLIEENPSMAADFDNIGEIQEYIIGDVKGPHGSDIFFVDAEKGNIQINDNTYLNFEELYPNNSYEVQIVVQGQKNDLIINRTVVVVDVNEKPVSRDTTFSVKETVEGGTIVGTLWATDPDSCSKILASACRNGTHPYGFNKLVYTIVDEDDDLPFEINQSSGVITLKQGEKLDFATTKEYEFKVKVMDRSLDPENPPMSTTATVKIVVTDVNQPSEFRVLSDLYETEENVAVGTSLKTMVASTLTVGKIVVYDEDVADIDKLKITITDMDATTARDAANLFEVVQDGKTDSDRLSTFVIKTKKDINYEDLYKVVDKNAIFNVTLTIDDASTDFTHTSQTTKIRVIDVNEEPTVTAPAPFTIAENTTKATSLGKITADDPDKFNANFGTLYFSLKGDEAAQFDIDASTGELSTINNAKFDYETKSSYKFKAVVTDKTFTKEVDVVVNVKDMPEVPKFPDNPPALAVDENTLKGTKVGDVVATDDDCKDTLIATCKQPTYSLTATDIAATDYKSFTIDKNGTITVAQDSILDYETKKEYSVRVVATDGSDPTLSSYIDVTIKINDVNDAPTYAKKKYVFEIHESAPKGEFVGSVVAGDQDSWSKLTYTLSDYVANSKDSEVFKIDPATGKIYLDATIDYETKNTYEIWAKATDNGKDKGFENYSASTFVTIKLIDDPDKPVIVDDGKKGYDVKENTVDNNTPTGFEIACYEVQDQDKDQVATLVPFVKDAGDTDADRLFDAKLKKNGSKYEVCLTVKNGAKLNYETIAHEHNVIVSVIDADNQTAEVKKTINIIDVNEMPIISGTVNFSFYEDKAPHVIGKLFPDDLDTLEAFRDDIFTVVGGDVDLFEISEDGKVKTKRKFDYETEEKRTFELIVALSDRNKTDYPKLTTQEKLTITLKDMPEVPEITSKEFDVDENSKAGTEVGVLKATDPDGTGKLLYELTEESPYVVVTPEGVIKVREGADIDYEKMQEFTIKVIVKDEDGLQSLPEEVIIKVNDLNEPPTIKPQTFVFYEDDPPGTKTGPIEASDPDTKNEKFSKLTYSLVDSSDVFTVTPDGDIEVKGKLDYETQKTYVVKVAVTDGKSTATTDVTINLENVVEKSEVEITRVEAGDSIYLNPPKENPIYTNKDVILVEWKQDGKTKSSLDTLKEGKNVIIKTYKDPSRDLEGADTIVVFYSTAAPLVEVTAKKTVVTADNIYTVVESVDKKDSSIYVNNDKKDVLVIVKDTVAGISDTFDVDVKLNTVTVPNTVVKTLTEVAKSQPTLNKNPKSGVKENPINGEKTKISYEETVSGNKVTVSYNVDNNGKIIKEAVIDEYGEKTMIEVIEVSTVVEVNKTKVVVSYKADAKTGKMLYGDSEGNLLTSKPSSSSSKPTSSSSSKKGRSSSSSKKGSETTSDDVDLKVGVGAFTVTYDADGVDGNKATITYVVDEKGDIVANEEGDKGYLVTYTYTNRYGNSADKSVFMVLDKLPPVVKIMSPADGDVVYANNVDVDWCIAIDGNEKNCVKQDTLNFQSLSKGVNTIKRIYRDKAGNETIAEVKVMMKKAKDVDISLEKPMIIVNRDTVKKYYEINPPLEDQTFAVSIVNPTTQKEKEVIKGFMDEKKNKEGSGEEPYPGLDSHLGPTFQIDLRLPIATSVGGLATLDDIVVGDMVPLDGVDAAESKKVSVNDYVKDYCSSEFREEFNKTKDFSKANLYSSIAHVTLWFYSFDGGRFIDKYSFEYDVNDPEFVDKAGLMKFFYEMKLDLDGELKDSHGRLYGTGPFIVKTKVDLRSKLRCVVPPIDGNAKIGDILKSGDELTRRFGYRRPVLRNNEKASGNTSKNSSSKSSSKKSSSKKK